MIASSGGEKIASEDRVVRRLIAYSTGITCFLIIIIFLTRKGKVLSVLRLFFRVPITVFPAPLGHPFFNNSRHYYSISEIFNIVFCLSVVFLTIY